MLLSFPTSPSNCIGHYDTLVIYIMVNHNFIIIGIHLTLFSIRTINEHLHPYQLNKIISFIVLLLLLLLLNIINSLQ